jgi:hypothetical protein
MAVDIIRVYNKKHEVGIIMSSSSLNSRAEEILPGEWQFVLSSSEDVGGKLFLHRAI